MCGIKATNALSENFVVKSYRNGEVATLTFKNGEKQGDLEIKKCSASLHGCHFTFTPSPIFLGKKCQIVADDLINWIYKIHFLCPKDLIMNLIIEPRGKGSITKNTYKNKGGILQYLKDKVKEDHIVSPILNTGDTILMKELMTNKKKGEDFGKEFELDRKVGIEFAFCLVNDQENIFTDSFCNFVNTTENGSHYDAVRKAIIDYLKVETAKTINNKDSKDLSITVKDVDNCLSLVINCMTDLNPQFVAQIKNKVGNGELFAPIYSIAANCINKYFDSNANQLKAMTTVIKNNARARLAGTLAKKSVLKEVNDGLEDYKNDSLVKPENIKEKGAYRELFLVEGQSACAPNARIDPRTQGLFKFRGFPANSWGAPLNKIVDEKEGNRELRNLCKALGCNVGHKFDITKLKYDKIIIMTDSDSDGYGISTLLAAFFVYVMPDIVKAGKLYKVLSPLYKLQIGNSKDSVKYVRSKMELIAEFEKIVSVNVKLSTSKGIEFKGDMLQDFLYINRNYLSELNKAANHYSVHNDLIEFLITYYDAKDFNKRLKKKFPEIAMDKNVLVGVYEGAYQILIVDDLLIKNLLPLIKIKERNNNIMELMMKEKTSSGYIDNGMCTIGQIMQKCEKYQPKILFRYKGLGELNIPDLRETTLNPNNRELIQLQMTDLEKTLATFEILHGNALEERKALYQNIEVEKDELDN